MIQNTQNIYKNIISGTNYYNPTTYTPILNADDYKIGYIDRYFVGKRNQSEMMETSERDYNLTSSNIYKKIKIKWKVSGPLYNQYEGKILQNTGVINYNNLRIKEASFTFSTAMLILNNPKQFWRGF